MTVEKDPHGVSARREGTTAYVRQPASHAKAPSLPIIANEETRSTALFAPRISHNAEHARILELERRFASLPEYAAIARYILAR